MNRRKCMKINEAIENYLETILILSETKEKVRMSDVAKHLNVSKPSVNSAMNKLQDNGYIIQEFYGTIQLTPKGLAYATKVYSRHKLFREFLIKVLKINPIVAEEDACHMEHCVSDETMASFEVFIKEQLELVKQHES